MRRGSHASRSSRGCANSSTSSSATCRPASAPRAADRIRRRTAPRGGTRRALGSRARLRQRDRPRAHRGARLHRRRRPRGSLAPRVAARREQFGTLGSGNHFLEVATSRRSSTRKPRACSASNRGDHGHDPLRLARPRLPGLRRLPWRDGQRGEEIRHRTARPPARLRAGRFTRRPALPRRDAVRGQLRLRNRQVMRTTRARPWRALG